MADQNQPFLSRPKDKTLEAYKAWMNEILDRMLPSDTPDDIPENEWEADWKKFWANSDTQT